MGLQDVDPMITNATSTSAPCAQRWCCRNSTYSKEGEDFGPHCWIKVEIAGKVCGSASRSGTNGYPGGGDGGGGEFRRWSQGTRRRTPISPAWKENAEGYEDEKFRVPAGWGLEDSRDTGATEPAGMAGVLQGLQTSGALHAAISRAAVGGVVAVQSLEQYFEAFMELCLGRSDERRKVRAHQAGLGKGACSREKTLFATWRRLWAPSL